MKRGIATFTLDYGRCPRWLFERMVKLSREMIRVLVEEYGPDEFVARISDPVWFQSLGTVLAFDWNASGLTTVLTGALKEALRGREREWGLFICGGKGKTSRKTPDEIVRWGEALNFTPTDTTRLVYSSRLSAKVDSALVQDGYQLYHHAFFFSKNGAWAVVQQGMNTLNSTARRYHWFDTFNFNKDFVNEPHQGIVAQQKRKNVLNLTSSKSAKTRDVSSQLIQAGTKKLSKDLELLRKHSSEFSRMLSFKARGEQYTLLRLENREFKHHPVEFEDFNKSKYLDRIFAQLADQRPATYEQILATPRVGPKTIRALALISEIIYGAKPSYEDPARYSFAHGGKDATPYPIDRKTYDQSIEMLRRTVTKTRLSFAEKESALKRLSLI
jgi:hypothetical protein